MTSTIHFTRRKGGGEGGSKQQEQKRVFELTRHRTNEPKLCCCKINGLHLSARGRGCGVATKRHVKEEEGGGRGGGLEALNMMMSFLNISNSEGPTPIYVFDFVLVLVFIVRVFIQVGNKMWFNPAPALTARRPPHKHWGSNYNLWDQRWTLSRSEGTKQSNTNKSFHGHWQDAEETSWSFKSYPTQYL